MDTSTNTAQANPIIIVTGANSGIGFGICQRLLLQLSGPTASDSLPQPAVTRVTDAPPFRPVSGLTLILACRNAKKAEVARQKLLVEFEKHVEQQRRKPGYTGHEETFRRNLRLDFVKCDLSRTDYVFDFCDEIRRKYPYISYLVLNAGMMSYGGIDWWIATKQLATAPIEALTLPKYKIQIVGETTDEGFGYTWQCNVFGHFIMTKELDSMLRSAPDQPARVIWMSSFEGQSEFFDLDDWQLVRTNRAYEGSKYQCDLLPMVINAKASEGTDTDVPNSGPRHFTVHPCSTASDIVIPQMMFPTAFAYIMLGVFYLARLIGSQRHPISPMKGGVSATHAMLAPLACLPSSGEPIKLGSMATFLGRSYVGADPIDKGRERMADGVELLRRLTDLYNELRAKRLASKPL